MSELNWKKSENGLIPAIVQDANTNKILMLGYMNEESYAKTLRSKRVTFYSRSRQSIWTKGETSGNFLDVIEILPDCDGDTLLIRALPQGATCHRGTETCFDDSTAGELSFLPELEKIIDSRFREKPEGSYIAQLIDKGLDRMAQKVGEEAVETVIAAKNAELDAFEGEASDLLFHLMVLLHARGSSLAKLAGVLRGRHASR